MVIKKDYKYKNDKDLSKDLFKQFDDYFKPLFASSEISKKTFILQIINFILVFLLLNFIIGDLLESLITRVEGSAIFAIRIFLLILIVGLTSAFSKNKVLRWQTLFDMSRSLTKKYLKRLIIINITLYGAKKVYKSYGEGN